MLRSTLPAPAQPEDDPRWIPTRTSSEEYLRFQAVEDHLAYLRGENEYGKRLFNFRQGRPGEVMPFPPDSPFAHMNPRLDQMEATARWAMADKATRGPRPSAHPDDPPIDLDSVPWGHDALPWKCGLADIEDR